MTTGRNAPQGTANPKVCKTWERFTGDAGWAGVLAETAITVPARSAIVIYEPGTDVLALFAEAMLLLPEKYRWRVSFSTYASSVPPGETCLWRGLTKSDAEGAQGHGLHGALIINLGTSHGAAQGGPLVEAARTGKAVDAATIASKPPPPALAPAGRPRKPSADDADPAEQLAQVSLASLSPTQRAPIRESDDDSPAESPARRYIELGSALALGLGVGVLLVFLLGARGIVDLPNHTLSKEKADLQSSLKNLEVIDIPKLRSEIIELNNQVGTHKKESGNLNSSFAQFQESTNKRIAELTQNGKKLTGDLAEEKANRIDAQTARDMWKGKHDQLKTGISKLRIDYDALVAKQSPITPKADHEVLPLYLSYFKERLKEYVIKNEATTGKAEDYKVTLRFNTENKFFFLDEKDKDDKTKTLLYSAGQKKPQAKPFLTVGIIPSEGSVKLFLRVPQGAQPFLGKEIREALGHLVDDLEIIVSNKENDQQKRYRLKLEEKKLEKKNGLRP